MRIFILLLWFCSLVRAETTWRDVIQDELKKPALEKIIVTQEVGGSADEISVTNRTSETIVYSGTSRSAPQFFIEELKFFKWKPTSWAWCGTGSKAYMLKANETVKFNVTLPSSGKGIRLYAAFHSIDQKRFALTLLREKKK